MVVLLGSAVAGLAVFGFCKIVSLFFFLAVIFFVMSQMSLTSTAVFDQTFDFNLCLD